ncbi:hypothetical protein FHX14_000572 [Rhizobium sp. BK619]|nr:hypothetical protein [Rhizobium sp. BK619]
MDVANEARVNASVKSLGITRIVPHRDNILAELVADFRNASGFSASPAVSFTTAKSLVSVCSGETLLLPGGCWTDGRCGGPAILIRRCSSRRAIAGWLGCGRKAKAWR